MNSQTLVVRLSSLGDVILATSFLEALPPGQRVDWLVARGFGEVLRGHPRIDRLIEFDRRAGLLAWAALWRDLLTSGRYQNVVDLHSTLRTQIAWLLNFIFCGIKGPKWRRLPKQRAASWGYFFFKRAWPRGSRPRPWIERYAKFGGGTGQERPDFRFLQERSSPEVREVIAAIQNEKGGRYFCVMPSSAWRGKEWAVDRWGKVIQASRVFPVILGGARDQTARALVQWLKEHQLDHYDAVGAWGLADVAFAIRHSAAMLGVDTGIMHLAEAQGVPVVTLFGPTAPDMGFGPYRAESRSISAPLWCRPCGKDGRACFRVAQRYLCQKQIPVSTVISALEQRRLIALRADERQRIWGAAAEHERE